MSNSIFDLTDKVAIVTGGGTGIGRSIALEFAKAGAHVVVASRKLANLEKVVREVKALGRRSLAIATDVSRPEEVENMVKKTMEEFGKLDILVNNAGTSYNDPAVNISPGGWDAVVGINLKGVFLCSQAAGRVMIEQKHGNIVNISSEAGESGSPGMVHYAAAKAGVNNLTRSLALEWAQYNIRVNCIAPGPIVTEGLFEILKARGETEWPPVDNAMNRRGQPEEIATACVFLASDASSFITGQTIAVNGGPQRRRR